MVELCGRMGERTSGNLVRVAREAMATRFEVALDGGEPANLRALAEEALAEVDRLEAQLSFYRRESELSGLNARAGLGPVRVDPRFLRLLERAVALGEATGGAFDPTVGPLVRCWGFAGGEGRVPDPQEAEAALAVVGLNHLILAEDDCSVAFDCDGVTLDLGAIGKGYALERAAAILREGEVSAALLHAGTSSVYGLGAPGGEAAWKVAIRHPLQPEDVIAVASLRDQALGVSAPHGKYFDLGGVRYGHVIDPRSGRPVRAALLAAVLTNSPTDADALSTGLLALGEGGLDTVCAWSEGTATLVVAQGVDGGDVKVHSRGWDESPPHPRPLSTHFVERGD